MKVASGGGGEYRTCYKYGWESNVTSGVLHVRLTSYNYMALRDLMALPAHLGGLGIPLTKAPPTTVTPFKSQLL